MDNFAVLFIPILLIGIAALWAGFNTSINFFINAGAFVLGALCTVICAFALLVQYVNWKYYKE